jgi:hypothetical protein
MARLQILELPEGASDDRAPFVLVIDQAEPALDPFGAEEAPSFPDDLAEKIGARAVLVFETTADIPANDTPLSPAPIEGTFRGIAEQIQAGSRYIAERYGDQPAGQYDSGGVPPPQWRLDHELAQRRDFITRLSAALGIKGDNPAIDFVELARTLRSDHDAKQARMEAAAQLHQHVEHRGQTICGHCSAWDGTEYGSTDNSPVLWPCDTIKALTGYVDDDEAGTASRAP